MPRLKDAAFRAIRAFHLRWFRRDRLPDRLAIYGHALDPAGRTALASVIELFLAEDYRFVGPDDFLKPDATKRVFLSFDDNFRSWYEALPVFQRLGVTATFYLNAGPIRDRASPTAVSDYFDRIGHTGERVTLSTAEVREMADAGHTIGSHTFAHGRLRRVHAATAQDDIRRGKDALEEILGGEVPHFAYPYGMRRDFSARLRRYCVDIGVRTIATARPIPHARHRPLALHRILWRFDAPLAENLENLHVDGRVFEAITGRSPIG